MIIGYCKRNNIKKLKWSTNKYERINHTNGCNMTVHRDFANKSCPGEYLYNKHTYIALEVNKKLKKTNRYFYTFSVIETVVLLGVSIWQFYYMKNLFEIKGSL